MPSTLQSEDQQEVKVSVLVISLCDVVTFPSEIWYVIGRLAPMKQYVIIQRNSYVRMVSNSDSLQEHIR